MFFSSCAFVLAFLASMGGAYAESVATVPFGVMTVTIAGSPNGSAYAQTPFSIPLLTAEGITGQSSGRLTGVTGNTLSNSNAGWIASALATTGSPYFVNITSGTNAGRMFQITGNTATQLTVNPQGQDLSTLGIAAGANGDTYQIVQGNTLLGILGTPEDGVVGGTSEQFQSNTIDKILVTDPSNGTTFSYYYDSVAQQWRRIGSVVNQGFLVISPKAGLNYSRISMEAIEIQFTGEVPSIASIHQIPALGTTLFSNYFPTDTTLFNSGIHAIAGWKSANVGGVTVDNSDRVVLKVGATFFSYYFDAAVTQWRRIGSVANQNSVVIPAGGAVQFVRTGVAGQTSKWARSLPYSLN